MQILILGMHRSGTSAIARIINMMGAYFGPEGVGLPPGNDNPKGFWERRDVMALNDNLLKLQHCRWHELANWQYAEAAKAPPELRQPMQSLVLGLDAHRPWFIKDPRLCLTLPAWRPLLEAPVAVLVYRNPIEIAISLHKRNGLPLAYALALWEYYIVGLLNASLNLPRIGVSHSDILSRPVLTAEALYTQLVQAGVRRLAMPSGPEIRSFIDPRLYRARPQEDTALTLSPEQQLLCELLQGKQAQEKPVQLSAASSTLIRAGLPATP